MFLYLFASPFPWGDVISGTAGLINGIFNSAATNRANKRNIQFAKESQAEQERFAKEMFNMENAYNAPEAVMQRLASAGINPNAYWSQSSGTAGMASGDSSVSPVTPNIQPVPSPIQSLVGSSPFESIMKLKEIRKIESETKRQDIENEYLGDWYSQEIAKGEAKAALDRAEKQLRDLNIKWFDKSKRAELRKYQNEAFYFAAAGKNQRAQAALTKWKEKFEKWHLEEYAPEMLNEIQASIKLLGEQATTEGVKRQGIRAGAFRDVAEGNKSIAETKTINESREDLIEGLKANNYYTRVRAVNDTFDTFFNRGLTTLSNLSYNSARIKQIERDIQHLDFEEKREIAEMILRNIELSGEGELNTKIGNEILGKIETKLKGKVRIGGR